MTDRLPHANGATHPPAPLTASVAIASYNGAAFIRAQIDSIIAQSEPPDEIVVTDDSSSDGTLDLLAEYASAPVPIRVHVNDKQLGYARNFGRAASLCRSELIFFCDQDDIWMPNKIERMKEAFADPAVFLAYHNALVVSADQEPLYHLYEGETQRTLLAIDPLDPWHASYGMTQAFRSSLRNYDDLWPRAINHIHRENELLAHDQWYFFLAQVLGSVVYVDEVLVHYRQHDNNAVGAARSASHGGFLRRLASQLNSDARIDNLKAKAALRRAEILNEIRCRGGESVEQRARLIAHEYRGLAERLQRRHRAYTAPSVWDRGVQLTRMMSHFDYGRRPWRFHPPSIVRDFISGVIRQRVGSEAPAASDGGA